MRIKLNNRLEIVDIFSSNHLMINNDKLNGRHIEASIRY